MDIADKLEMESVNVQAVRRLPARDGRPGLLVAEMNSRSACASWVLAGRTKELTVGDVFSETPREISKDRIYIREALTPEVKSLLFNTKQKLRDSYKFIWCKDGRVLVRKTDSSKVVPIRSLKDIELLATLRMEIPPRLPACRSCEYLGPGPGAYKLPTTVGFPAHDPSRTRAPMFSFGSNAGYRVRGLGPGPAYRIDRVTRDGVMASPAWSFGARFATRSTLRTPGPGAHAPERCPPQTQRAPICSMGARLGFGLRRPGPAPNAYALRMGPGTPAYTMGARVGYNLKAKSPGPAVYRYFQRNTDVYKSKMPVYSLGARLDGAGKATRTPGPAAYPPNLYNVKKNPYAYSFGTKHGDYAPPMIVKEDTMDCL